MRTTNIGVIDFGIGNLKSIIQILKKISLNLNIYLINRNFKNFNIIDKIIIPGQGSCYSWMKKLIDLNCGKIYKIILNKPVFGICVGKQIFYEKTEEFENIGLKFLKGVIKKTEIKNNIYKIPHIGWNRVFFLKKHFLINNIKNYSFFYFSHSFYLNSEENNYIYGLTKYNFYYPSIFIKNNLFLTQFHPEKSFKQGFALFQNFCLWNS